MQTTNELAVKFLPWYKRWVQMRRYVPVTFHITVPSSIEESSRVTVEVSVENPGHAASERLSKLPDYFIRDELGAAEVTELVPLLSRIQGVTGRSTHDALALLATFQVMAMDSFVANEDIGIRGMSDAFVGAISPSMLDRMKPVGSFHPVFSTRAITGVWASAVLPFLKVYTLNPVGSTFVVFYDTIPPFNLDEVIPLEQLREADFMSDTQLQRALEILQNEQLVTVDKLKRASATVRGLTKYDASRPSKEVMIDLADGSRFKSSGKINYAAVAKKLGRDPKTVKAWFESYGIR